MVTPVRGLGEVAQALELAPGGRLGMCLDMLPARAYLDWQRRLPGVEIADASALVQAQRAIKDDFEIERMTAAGALAAQVFAEIPRLLRPGVSEVWLAGQLQALAMARGHIDLLRTRGAFLDTYSWHVVSGPEGAAPSTIDAASLGYGLSPAFPLGASHKPLKPHEPIVVDFGVCLAGYQTDQTRTYCLGAAPANLRAAHACLKDVQRVILEMLRPGAVSGDIYAAAKATARAHGLEEGFLGRPEQRTRFCGHGLGLELGVPPYLLEGSRARVRARETYALELKMVIDEGPVGLENTVLVREDGPPVILSPIPDELVEVAL
jgi:Xaa-Pro aminopeptidase